ncbi:MAG TPA: glycosyltransferase family 39 protein [Alphaproteobacteria bacterium]
MPATAPPSMPPADAPRAFAPGAVLLVLGTITALRLVYLPFHPLDLHPDEAQYWSWSRDLDWGYFSKPPMIAWLVAASTSLCGAGEACIRATIPVLHFLTALLIYGIGRRLYEDSVGFLAALAYLTLPGVTFSSAIASTDPPLLTFWALGLYALVRLMGAGASRRRWWIVLGIALGLGLLSKYAMAFFVAALILWLALDAEARARLVGDRAGRRGLALAAALGALIYLPNLVWNATQGFVTYAHTGANADLGGGLVRPAEFLDFAVSQFGVFGPVLFAMLLGLVAGASRWRAEMRARMLAAFVLAVLVPVAALALLTRANANWAAPAYVAGSVWVTAAMLEGGRRALAWSSVGLHVAFAAVLMGGLLTQGGAGRYAGLAVPAWLDPYRDYRGWRALGDYVGVLRASHPGAPLLANDRKLLAAMLYYVRPWPEDAFAWFADGRVTDHYRLTRPLPPRPGGDFLYVTRWNDNRAVLRRFREHRLVATLALPVATGVERRVRVFHVQGFLGYNARRP